MAKMCRVLVSDLLTALSAAKANRVCFVKMSVSIEQQIEIAHVRKKIDAKLTTQTYIHTSRTHRSHSEPTNEQT